MRKKIKKEEIVWKDYNYAWIYGYDILEIINLKEYKDIDNILEKHVSEELLIEMRIFNKTKEVKINFQNGEYSFMKIKKNEEYSVIKDKCKISNNKAKKIKDFNTNYETCLLVSERIINYKKDGQAYIKDQRLIDIEFKEYMIKKEA
ncbi:MAG: hypothetical protein ACQEQF_08025 [Bacillota bacterium]